MEIALGTVQKPVRRLRKSLKSLPPDPSIEAVHDLRTYTRRVEAIVAALRMDHEKASRRLLKTIKAVRKAAGAVRDMDVLAGNAITLARNRRDESVLRLLQHLHDLRIESAHQLIDAVAEHRKDARRGLRRLSRQIEKWFAGRNPGEVNSPPGAPHGHTSTRLLNELRHWPELNAGNLHAFRIKVKELRYMLQLSDGADSGLLDALDRAREQIGDWHDWQELAKIAEKTLEPHTDRAALKKIAETGDRKFDQALRAAEEVKALSLLSPKPAAARAGFAARSSPA
ncbi:MAG TPA: CHAD domain-containing protein [Terracidiphilus sp.]|nr:CHAD domain-containing protein [Terracidiphilus sp.]